MGSAQLGMVLCRPQAHIAIVACPASLSEEYRVLQ